MGAWGAGLYANDTTCDVKDIYMGYLMSQLSDEESHEKTMEKFREYLGTDEEPLFWYALADTQWRVGRLRPEVRAHAIEWLDRNGGLEFWEESASKGAGWKKTMAALRERLDSPMPARKTVRAPRPVDENPWQLNDVYAYQFHTEASKERGCYGKYMILQKIGEGRRLLADVCMRIQVLDKMFDELPSLDDIDGLRILPLDLPYRDNISKPMERYSTILPKDPIWMSVVIIAGNYRNYPRKYLTFLGNKPGPVNRSGYHDAGWNNVEDWLYKYYTLWQNKSYDTLEDGVFDYQQTEEDLELGERCTKEERERRRRGK